MTRDEFSSSSDDAVDALLARAHWPEPSPDSTHRLLVEWRSVTPRRFAMHVPLTAAAAVLLAGIILGMMWHIRSPLALVNRPHAVPADLIKPEPIRGFEVEPVPVREANALEVMLIQPRKAAHKPRIKFPGNDEIKARADQAVEQAQAAESQQELDKLAASLAPRRAYAGQFARIAATSVDDRRTAAVRLLAQCGDGDSTAALLMFYQDRATQVAALAGVARLADAVVLGALIRHPQHRADQPVLVDALLRREAGVAVPIYLSLIKDGTISPTTAGPRNVPMQTMELIFSELNNPRIAMRTVAARALGQIDGPATTARLVEMVTADTNRREALMALAYSNGPEAKEFLARALSSATLRSAVRSVLLQMKS